MLDLRDLIIERIEEVATLSENKGTRGSGLQDPPSLDLELRVNRSVLKSLAKAKKRQKQRSQMEELLLQETKSLQFWQSSVLQNVQNPESQVYSTCSAIFSGYDSSYLSLLESTESTSAKLLKLYDYFLKKQSVRLAGKRVPNFPENNITNISPAVLLGLISEWSRTFFMQKLQSAMSAQFDRHQLQMKQITALRNNILGHNEKILNPLSFSTHIQRSNENSSVSILTNKQSVYGLFLDEMTQYYRSLPLQLDYSFIKNIRKIHSKGNEFEKEDNLQKAAEILIEAKNKTIKDQMQAYKQFYLQKNPLCLQAPVKLSRHAASHSPRKPKCIKNASASNSYGIQRIKSQSKEEQFGQSQEFGEPNRKSLLLCRKFKEISFDSSQLFKKKAKRRFEKQQFELPELINHKLVANHSKSTVARTKPIHLITTSKNKVFQQNNRQVSPKNFNFKEPYFIDKLLRKDNYSMNKQMRIDEENPEKLTKRGDGDELRRNRKLMLQLLREKNRNSLFE